MELSRRVQPIFDVRMNHPDSAVFSTDEPCDSPKWRKLLQYISCVHHPMLYNRPTALLKYKLLQKTDASSGLAVSHERGADG